MNARATRTNRSGVPIQAKSPDQVIQLTEAEFKATVDYIAQAFCANVPVPKEFFQGVPLTGLLKEDAFRRTLLSVFAYFRKDPRQAEKSLAFHVRYQALLKLFHDPKLRDQFFFVQPGDSPDSYTCVHPSLLAAAAVHPVKKDGTFDADALYQAFLSHAHASGTPVSAEPVAAKIRHDFLETVTPPSVTLSSDRGSVDAVDEIRKVKQAA